MTETSLETHHAGVDNGVIMDKMNNIEEQEKLQKFVEKYPQHNFPGLAYSN
jgi:hypothetical protein